MANKTKHITLRVEEDLKLEMINTAKYYHMTLSNYLTVLHITTRDIDSKSIVNNAITTIGDTKWD